MKNFDYDYIVIGVGGIGSATLYWLTRTAPNAKILGLEQFELGHGRGGSQDHSRIIWREIEEDSGLKLIYKTGGLFWTSSNTGFEYMLNEYEKAGVEAGSQVERLNADQIMKRWPQFTVGSSVSGVFDPQAGLVDAVMANGAHQQCALARGATILSHAKVHRLSKLPDTGMTVVTTKGEFSCRKIIVTAGAWINQVLESVDVHIPVRVTQENVTYFATPHLKDFTKEKFPIFIYMDKQCDYYGFPVHGLPAFKIGLDAMGTVTTGDTRTFSPDPVREKLASNFLGTFIPKALGRIIETKTCLYTMTYDRCFLIDTLAPHNYPDVIVCCGAGHAYKFSALFGKILSELAVIGKPDVDISGFGINRPAITDPSYQPDFHFTVAKKSNVSKL